jgi:hypothetical protein
LNENMENHNKIIKNDICTHKYYYEYSIQILLKDHRWSDYIQEKIIYISRFMYKNDL